MRCCALSFAILLALGFYSADSARLSKTGRELMTQYQARPSWGYFEHTKDGYKPLTEEEFYELVFAAQSEYILEDGYEDYEDDGKDKWSKKLKRTYDWQPGSSSWAANSGTGGPAIKDRFVDSVVDLAGFPEDRALSYSDSRALGPFGYSVAATGGYATDGIVNSVSDGVVDADGNMGSVASQTILDATAGGVAKGGTVAKVYTTPVATFGTNLGGFLATPGALGTTTGTVSGSTSPFYFSLGK